MSLFVPLIIAVVTNKWYLCSSTVFFLRNVLDMMAIRRVSDTQDLPFRKCVGWATGHSCSSSKWQLPEQCCDRYHSAITSQHSGPSLLLWTICDTVLRFLVAVVLMTRLSFAREGERAFRLQRNSTDQLSRGKLEGWAPFWRKIQMGKLVNTNI